MRPWTHGSWALEIHGLGTDGGSGSGYADRPPGYVSLTWHFRSLLAVVISLVAGLGLGVLYSEGVGWSACWRRQPALDAVSVDLQQDRDAVPGPAATSVAAPRVPAGRSRGRYRLCRAREAEAARTLPPHPFFGRCRSLSRA